VFSGLTQWSGYTFNGSLEYQQDHSWNPYLYNLTSTNSRFLTNSPSADTYVKNSTDRGYISFYNNFSGTTAQNPNYTRVSITRISGGTSEIIMANQAYSSFTTDNRILHMPSGIWNLNNLSAGALVTGATPIINIDTDSQYSMTVLNSAFTPMSETRIFKIDQTCTKAATTRIMFLGKLGQMEFFNFNLVNRHKIKISNRQIYKQVLPYNYTVGNRGRTSIDSTVQESVTLEANWISDAESQFLVELYESNEVYELLTDGTILPIIVDTDSFEIKRTSVDKLFRCTLDYSYAFTKNNPRN